ncbi:TetR family transcriptional regulator [Clostridia bacterium]|nr:TetR family transcriptional regulator [Clostridia bacterium]
MPNAQGKRQLQKVATREHIIETAMSVYPAQGFSVPTNIIAQEAGVAHGTIFVHFPTKENLLFHALERFAEKIGGKLHGLSTSNSDMEALLRAHIEIIGENEAFYKNLIAEISSLSPDTRTRLVSLNSITSHHFGIALQSGIEAGKFKKLSVHMAYNTWLGLVHYYLQNSEFFAPSGESVMERYKDELVNSYIELLNK